MLLMFLTPLAFAQNGGIALRLSALKEQLAAAQTQTNKPDQLMRLRRDFPQLREQVDRVTVEVRSQPFPSSDLTTQVNELHLKVKQLYDSLFPAPSRENPSKAFASPKTILTHQASQLAAVSKSLGRLDAGALNQAFERSNAAQGSVLSPRMPSAGEVKKESMMLPAAQYAMRRTAPAPPDVEPVPPSAVARLMASAEIPSDSKGAPLLLARAGDIIERASREGRPLNFADGRALKVAYLNNQGGVFNDLLAGVNYFGISAYRLYQHHPVLFNAFAPTIGVCMMENHDLALTGQIPTMLTAQDLLWSVATSPCTYIAAANSLAGMTCRGGKRAADTGKKATRPAAQQTVVESGKLISYAGKGPVNLNSLDSLADVPNVDAGLKTLAKDLYKQREVSIKTADGQTLTGTLHGVADDGFLILRTRDGLSGLSPTTLTREIQVETRGLGQQSAPRFATLYSSVGSLADPWSHNQGLVGLRVSIDHVADGDDFAAIGKVLSANDKEIVLLSDKGNQLALKRGQHAIESIDELLEAGSYKAGDQSSKLAAVFRPGDPIKIKFLRSQLTAELSRANKNLNSAQLEAAVKEIEKPGVLWQFRGIDEQRSVLLVELEGQIREFKLNTITELNATAGPASRRLFGPS